MDNKSIKKTINGIANQVLMVERDVKFLHIKRRNSALMVLEEIIEDLYDINDEITLRLSRVARKGKVK